MQFSCFVLSSNNNKIDKINKQSDEIVRERNAKRTEFIHEQIGMNLERWKQSDIIHITPNNIYIDMTFNQINYAMDFTWFFSGLFGHRFLYFQFLSVGFYFVLHAWVLDTSTAALILARWTVTVLYQSQSNGQIHNVELIIFVFFFSADI